MARWQADEVEQLAVVIGTTSEVRLGLAPEQVNPLGTTAAPPPVPVLLVLLVLVLPEVVSVVVVVVAAPPSPVLPWAPLQLAEATTRSAAPTIQEAKVI